MRIMGIDPGTIDYGIGVIEDGAYLFSEERHLGGRLMLYRLAEYSCQIRHDIIEWHPDLIVIEDGFIGDNPQTGLAIGLARGIAIGMASLDSIPVVMYKPTEIKKAVCKGNATKEQVRTLVRAILHISRPLGLDESDALAAALCGWAGQKKAV